MENKEIAHFYDDFSNYQKQEKINKRIYSLYRRAIDLGLKSSSNILELGCGIGVVSYVFSKYIKEGSIESVDLSPKSIEIAREKVKSKNLKFKVGDVVSYTPEMKSIDFITLFDVIEHIPLERHAELFKNISKYMHDDTILLINIPNPDAIAYYKKHKPEALQIIDQSVHLDFLSKIFMENNLTVAFYEKYTLWDKYDYDFYVVEKKKEYKLIRPKPTMRDYFRTKLLGLKLRLFYNDF